jgi:D-lactate dehydrogenase
MGYGLNSFTDFDEPLDILTHLMVGSEGTLGFISKVVFETLPVEPHTATALLVFARLEDATDSLESLIDAGAKTLELMDPAAIAAARAAVGVGGGAGNSRDPLGQVTAPTQTALLVESRASDQDELVDRAEALRRTLSGLRLASPVAFATSSTERDRLWMARNGLYTAVAGARPRGSTALLEDIAVPVARLSQTCAGLADLFAQHGFADSVIFGHAKDGNIHFMLTLDLDQAEQLNRLEDFTENMVDLVLAEGGTLKAEHGTGRVMAPFVRHQFGDELYEVQCQIKRLFDPDGVLAPGVLISDDQRGHMAHIKTMPRVDRAFDDCVECGYCEPSCPALNLTLSPRGRIAALRTIATLPPRNKRAAERLFAYDGVDTCAADSLCVIACPVGIDTGKLMKTQRSLRHSPAVQAAGALVARHWGGAVELLRAALVAASAIPGPVLAAITKTARTVLPKDWIPLAGNDLPGPGTRRRGGVVGDQAGPVSGAYFPSCVNSLFAPAPGGPGVGAALDQLCRAAGIALLVPKPIGSLCCGTVWESKGLTAGANAMARMTFDALWQASGGGALPVVCDAASCSHGLQALADRLDETRAERASRLRVVDSVSFVLNEVVPRLRIDRVLGGIAVHPTCSTVQLGAKDDLIALAGLVAKTVFVPPTWGCCAFAGDRGMLHPELTKAATRPEAEAVWAAEAEPGRFDAYVSANRTCELGISRATGRIYRHVLEVLAANSHAL